ncbi:MAG TPA: hypothetical protein VND44_05315 [Acidimicrobiales bacterium]|nr:hypothetical protein [Acidimicrobiales bacterium]
MTVLATPSQPRRDTRLWLSSLAVRLRPSSWGANWPVWTCILGIGIVLKAELAPQYFYISSDDDQLMVQMAKGFLDGHWSSNWATTGVATLVKPVGYPLFLTSAHFLPWSPVLTAYLLYLIGAVLIAWSWWLIAGSRAQSTVILAVLVFQPVIFATGSQRIYRDSFIESVATIAIGLSFVIAAQMRTSPSRVTPPGLPDHPSGVRSLWRHWAGRMRIILLYLLALLVGVLIGVVMITKPTWQWLVIAVIAPVAFPLIQKMRQWHWQRSIIVRACVAGVLAVSGAYGVVATTIAMNQRTYHVALVEDLSAGAFARAWKAWASVEAGPPEPHVVITRDMRMAVYRVSPAASRLRPYLESPTDKWKRQDCSSLNVCNDSGPWFEWDLQYAAVSAGAVHSVKDVQTYFSRLADEITTACASKRLRCSSIPVLAPGLPTLDRIPRGALLDYAVSGLWQMVSADVSVGPPKAPVAAPDPVTYAYWASVVPGMSPSSGSTAAATTHRWTDAVVRMMTKLFGIGNLALFVLLLLGPLTWLLRRIRRRHRAGRGVDWRAATPSLLFLVSTLIGMGTLAVFAAASGDSGYTSPLYWSDFATPAELCLVLGAIASLPILRDELGRRRVNRVPIETDDVDPSRGVLEPL